MGELWKLPDKSPGMGSGGKTTGKWRWGMSVSGACFKGCRCPKPSLRWGVRVHDTTPYHVVKFHVL